MCDWKLLLAATLKCFCIAYLWRTVALCGLVAYAAEAVLRQCLWNSKNQHILVLAVRLLEVGGGGSLSVAKARAASLVLCFAWDKQYCLMPKLNDFVCFESKHIPVVSVDILTIFIMISRHLKSKQIFPWADLFMFLGTWCVQWFFHTPFTET